MHRLSTELSTTELRAALELGRLDDNPWLGLAVLQLLRLPKIKTLKQTFELVSTLYT